MKRDNETTRVVLKKTKKGWIKKLRTWFTFKRHVEEPASKAESKIKKSDVIKKGAIATGAILGAGGLMSNDVYAASEHQVETNTAVTKNELTVKDESSESLSKAQSESEAASVSASASEEAKSQSLSASQEAESTSLSASVSASTATSTCLHFCIRKDC